MTDLSIHIRTLTPLWTGGVDGTMDRIHETGILGSLRWWYEAIVRGLGGSACDPTGDDRCPDEDGRYCDVCAVFGATGLQRAFRLEGPVWWNNRREERLILKVSSHKKHRGWYLKHGYHRNEGKISIVPLRAPQVLAWKEVLQTLALTLRLIECWGGLGPKTQVGYGVVGFDQFDDINAIASFQKLKQRSTRRTVPQNAQWPSLEGFFFAKVRFKVTNPERWIRAQSSEIGPNEELDWHLKAANSQRKAVLPLAPVVRYHMRSLIKRAKHKNNGLRVFTHEARHHLMGELGRGSLIHVSHAYPVDNSRWEFRIWGWIPETLPGNVSRDDVLGHLRRWLGIQQRQWHSPQNGALWSALNLTPTQVCWFERQSGESVEKYLEALLNECQETSHGGTGNTEKSSP